MRPLLVFIFSASLLNAQNSTSFKPLSCHLAEGSKTLLQSSAITGSIVLAYISAILPIVAEIVVAAIVRKLTAAKTPEDGGNDAPGTVVPVDVPLTSNYADLLAWYDRIGLKLFAAHASTSQPRVSQIFGTTFARASSTETQPPSVTTILTLGSAVIAVITGAAYPILNGWCGYESQS